MQRERLLNLLVYVPETGEWINRVYRGGNQRPGESAGSVRNCGISRNNTSGVVGVCWHSQQNKWRAYIMVNYRQVSLGLFDNIEDAAEARRAGEKKYFGGFRRCNAAQEG